MNEPNTCPVCGHVDREGSGKVVVYPARTSAAETPREIRFCPKCGLGSAFPMPTEKALERMYHNMGYWEMSDDDVSVRKQPVPYALARARWRMITSAIPRDLRRRGMKVLDIGAGHGYLGDIAACDRTCVLSTYAMVEPDSRMRKATGSRWKRYGYTGDLKLYERLSDVTERYDVVVLSHVLEHVTDPMSFMKEACSHIGTSGYLFLDVPNRDDLFKEDVFPHILFFSPRSVGELLARLNLDIIWRDMWGKSIERSPLNTNPPLLVRIRRSIVNRLVNRIPFFLSVPMVTGHFGFLSRNRSGTWIRALARKI